MNVHKIIGLTPHSLQLDPGWIPKVEGSFVEIQVGDYGSALDRAGTRIHCRICHI